MIGATTYPNGTAYAAMRGSVYTIAGKTGTDQVVNESVTGNLSEEHGFKKIKKQYRDNAWFIAFAPAEAPRIAIAVIVEHAGCGLHRRRARRPQGDGRLSPRVRRQVAARGTTRPVFGAGRPQAESGAFPAGPARAPPPVPTQQVADRGRPEPAGAPPAQ